MDHCSLEKCKKCCLYCTEKCENKCEICEFEIVENFKKKADKNEKMPNMR